MSERMRGPRRWLVAAGLSALVLGSCIVLPHRRTRQPIAQWLDGFALDRVEAATFHLAGTHGREQSLPREHWPRLVELVPSLEQLAAAEDADSRRKGFIYVWFGARERLYINFDEQQVEGGSTVVAWVHGGSKWNGYNAFDGSELWDWLVGVTADLHAGDGSGEGQARRARP